FCEDYALTLFHGTVGFVRDCALSTLRAGGGADELSPAGRAGTEEGVADESARERRLPWPQCAGGLFQDAGRGYISRVSTSAARGGEGSVPARGRERHCDS